MKYQLYRHFDQDGELLYVGMSISSLFRLAGHKRSSWFPQIRKITIEHYSSKQAARIEEIVAIRTENPRYNIDGVKAKHRLSPFLRKGVSDMGRLGGIARALKLSKRRRQEIARQAGKAPKRKRTVGRAGK